MKIQNRKSLSMGEAFPAVLSIAMIGMLFVAMIYLFMQFATAVGANTSHSVVNETVQGVTEKGVTVANSTDCNFANFAVSAVLLSSDNSVIGASNYTTTATGLVKFAEGGDVTYNDTNWKVSYSYKNGGVACAGVNTINNSFMNSVPLVGLVLAIVLIALVIGVLVAAFYMRGGKA